MAAFLVADANQDGVLDKVELADFMSKLAQDAAERGVPHMSEANLTDSEKDLIWCYFNGLTPEAEGVSAQDFVAGMKTIEARILELRNQKAVFIDHENAKNNTTNEAAAPEPTGIVAQMNLAEYGSGLASTA